MIEVLIVSDVRLYRDGLAEMVARDELVEVVGTAADARDAVQAAGALSPAVVIVNVAMRDGIPLARAIRFSHTDGPSTLTSREFEIADLIEHGLSNKQIASALFIEVTTVKNHVHRILEKLGVHRRADVAARIRGERLVRN